MHVGQVALETTFGEWIDTNVSQDSHLHRELVNSPESSDFSYIPIIESPLKPGRASFSELRFGEKRGLLLIIHK